ncbi:MAG: CapA family protein [Bacteroidetes bacterium]|nr:MAG: CapA family protein [Bacteroidota bacterium]
MKLIFISILIILQTSYLSCQSINSKEQVSNDSENLKPAQDSITKEISLLFLGDIMQHDLQIQSAYNAKTKKYDFSSQFKHIQPIIKKADVVIGNLEVTFNGKPYKGYPRFSSPDQLAFDIKNAGIDYLVTANNHIYDYGLKGFYKTLNVLDSAGIVHTGTFRNEADKQKRQPMVIEENGFKIALLNYTYEVNGGVYSSKILINEIDKTEIKKNLLEMSKTDYDAIIVFFHWGKEYQRTSNSGQKELAKLCFENGANMVIGSHPHVIQEMEKYRFKDKNGKEKDVLVAYSLGNYVSNYGTWRYCDGGAMISMKLQQTVSGEIKIENPGHYLIWVYRPKKTKSGKLRNYYVLPVSQFEKNISLGDAYLKQMKLFINDSRSLLKKNNKNIPEYLFNSKLNMWELN